MFGSERGSGMIWWVIILVILLVIASVVAYSFQGSLKEAEGREQALKAELDAEKAKVKSGIEDLGQLSESVGFGSETAMVKKPDNVSVKKFIADYDQKYEDVQASDNTLQKVVARLDEMYGAAVNRLNDANTAVTTSQTKEKAAMDQAVATATEKDKVIEQLQADIKAEQSRFGDAAKKSEDQITALRNQVSDLEGREHTAVATAKKEKNLLENRLLAKDAQIKEIQIHNDLVRSHDESDGEIVDVSPTTGIAYIDAGFRHGIKPGMKFRVFQWGKGGQKIWKGEVQVRDVDQDMSSVNVLSSPDIGNPVSKGDQISSPIFNRDRPPVFAFVGELPGRFSREEATRRLEAYGAKVADHVTADTDFLVVGLKEKKDGAVDIEETPEYKRAQEYGTDIINARELEKMLQY